MKSGASFGKVMISTPTLDVTGLTDYASEALSVGKRVVTPVKGEVCMQFIRCGKRECRCVRGELHGPYYYHVWRDGAKVRKVYVRSENVDYVRACCDAYREFSQALTDVRSTRRELTKNIMKTWRRGKPMMRAAAR